MLHNYAVFATFDDCKFNSHNGSFRAHKDRAKYCCQMGWIGHALVLNFDQKKILHGSISINCIYLRELVHCLTMSWHYLSIMNDYQIGPGPELKWRFLYLQHWLIQKNVRHHDLKKQYSIILRKIDFFSTVNKYINT